MNLLVDALTFATEPVLQKAGTLILRHGSPELQEALRSLLKLDGPTRPSSLAVHLPAVVLAHACEWLLVIDTLRLGLVCKRWRYVMKHEVALARVDLGGIRLTRRDADMWRWMRGRRGVRSLRLRCDAEDDKQFVVEFRSMVLGLSRLDLEDATIVEAPPATTRAGEEEGSLVELYLRNVSVRDVCWIAATAPRVRVLELHGCTFLQGLRKGVRVMAPVPGLSDDEDEIKEKLRDDPEQGDDEAPVAYAESESESSSSESDQRDKACAEHVGSFYRQVADLQFLERLVMANMSQEEDDLLLLGKCRSPLQELEVEMPGNGNLGWLFGCSFSATLRKLVLTTSFASSLEPQRPPSPGCWSLPSLVDLTCCSVVLAHLASHVDVSRVVRLGVLVRDGKPFWASLDRKKRPFRARAFASCREVSLITDQHTLKVQELTVFISSIASLCPRVQTIAVNSDRWLILQRSDSGFRLRGQMPPTLRSLRFARPLHSKSAESLEQLRAGFCQTSEHRVYATIEGAA